MGRLLIKGKITKKNQVQPKEELIKRDLVNKVSWGDICFTRKVSRARISRVAKSISNQIDTPLSLTRGRPPKVTVEVIEAINKETLDVPTISGNKLANLIAQKLNIDISRTTVNNIRNQLKFRFTRPRVTQKLTDSHIEKRLDFVEKELSGPIDWSKDVIFSDESRFSLFSDSRRVWVKRGVYNTGTFRSKQKFSKGIMVWGAIGIGWRSPLVVVRGNLDSQGYMCLLKENEIIEKLDEQYGERSYHFQ